MLSEGFYDKIFSSSSHSQAEYESSTIKKEQPEHIFKPHNPMTIAEYVAYELHKNKIQSLYASERAMRSSLFAACTLLPFSAQSAFSTGRQAIYAAIAHAKESGSAALICDEKELLSITEDVLHAIDDLVPLIICIIRSHSQERSMALGFPIGAKSKTVAHIKTSLEEMAGHYAIIDDRRTAGARVDRSIDIAQEMKLPVFLEMYEEVLQTQMPPHSYRRTIFNHEEHDLFYGAWETIISRLSRANAPLIAIGKQVRDDKWLSLLISLALEWGCELTIDEEIRGYLPIQLLENVTLLPSYGSSFNYEFDTVLSFGIESDNEWLLNLIEASYFSDDLTIEIFSVNSSSLFFGDGKDPFYIFCLEEFFQAASLFFKDFHEKIGNMEKIVQAHLKSKKGRSHQISSLDPLYHMNYTLPHATPIFVADVMADLNRIKETLLSTRIFCTPPNAPTDEWLFASLEGSIDSNKNQIVACATSSIELAESVLAYITKRGEEKGGHHSRILIILFTSSDTASLPSSLNTVLFRSLGALKEWIVRSPGELSPHGLQEIGVIPIPPLYI